MLNIWIDKTINRIVLQTDDHSVKHLLEVTKKETKYLPWKKQWGTQTITTKIYDDKRITPDKNGMYTFHIGLGFAAYIINTFKPYISQNDYLTVISTILSDSYRTIPFPELRDYQNEDILHLLKYKVGLFSCYTGYGKTQIIATLANYFYGLGKSVLIVTPQKKPNEEVVKRLREKFNLTTPSKDLRLNNMITAGLLNRKDVNDPQKLLELEKLWSSYEVILVDEVEYTINDSGMFLYDRLIGADYMLGFSGTADKAEGNMISFINGLDDTVIRNRNLIKYFGPSLVYRLPNSIDIDLIRVKTGSLATVKFEESDFAENSNVYLNIMTRIFTDPEVCKVMVKTLKKFPTTYIPMNNLANIISTWIDDYFIGTFRILLICFEGYIYYDLDGSRRKLKDLNEACEYVKNGLVDVIPSTSSGFRALDLPGLENALVLSGKCAGAVLQAIGRVARGTHMNIIGFDTISNRKVPVYTSGMKNRDDMIKNYYKYCNITESVIYETQL